MGLIKAGLNAVGGTLRDQYKEFIYCDALPMDVLVKKGQKKVLEGNTNKGNDNIITTGSKIAVSDGQCLLIVENGNIIDFCVETGEYIYDSKTSPSLLTGGFKGLKESFATMLERTKAGGMQDQDQRVYFVNLKEIMSNKVGSGDIPFRDSEFQFTIKLKYFGEYSYKITDPIMFYKNVVGNILGDYTRDKIDSQFKAEIQAAMQPALGRVALKKVAYDQLPLYTKEIAQELNLELTEEWVTKRGISIVSFAMASVTPDAESAKKIEEFQTMRVYTNTSMLGAKIGTAQADAMVAAASNENGAIMGFMGMGMAQQAGGSNLKDILTMGNQQTVKEEQKVVTKGFSEDTWLCSCGSENNGKFCSSCGKEKPQKEKWLCTCGIENEGKFCTECGSQANPKCINCGYTATTKFKFCPECGKEN